MASPQGRFVWYDLMTTDTGAARDFYRQTLGWGSDDWEGPEEYAMWKHGETPFGGVMTLPEEAAAAGAPPHWLGYVDTPDVDDACARAEELGGRVLHGPHDVPEKGRFAILADPQGAVFAAWQASREYEVGDAPPAVGEHSWHELATTDHRGAFEFYSQLFGWTVIDDMDMGEHGIYRIYGIGDRQLGGMFDKPPEMPSPAWLYYSRVADLDATVETVKAHGGQVVNGPMDVPGGDRIAQCLDPQGAMFALHERGGGS